MRRAKDVESAFVDDRVLAEPKARSDKPATGAPTSLGVKILRLVVFLVACALLGVQDMLFAALTTVSCQPAVVRAGTNVTCDVRTGLFSTDADLSITQTGTAGMLWLLSESVHSYRVAFATSRAGAAGVRLTHSIFWSRATVEVVPAAAATVEVLCAPPKVMAGAEVKCDVTPRDAFGNPADVEKPPGAADSYFSVSHVGGATALAVHDTYVSFVAGESGSRCGVAVVLDGRRVESVVQVYVMPSPIF